MAVQTIMIRRGTQVIKDVPAKLLIHNIRLKKLRGSDEMSADGEKWIRLDQHHQLGYFFRQKEVVSSNETTPPPNVANQMAELADMLREINQG